MSDIWVKIDFDFKYIKKIDQNIAFYQTSVYNKDKGQNFLKIAGVLKCRTILGKRSRI